MNLDTTTLRWIRSTLIALTVLAVLGVAADVLKPIALTVLLAFILDPPVRWFERRGLPRGAGVVLTLSVAFITAGGVGYVVGSQVMTLAEKLPVYEGNILKKVRAFRPSSKSTIRKVTEMADNVTKTLETEETSPKVPQVRVVEESSLAESLKDVLTPFEQIAGMAGVVLMLLFFLLLNSGDVQNRVVRLAGHGQISLTTKTLQQIGERLSRYLTTFALVNMGFGLVIGLGLWAVGLPYVVLWASLAAGLRFIPYVGPFVGFALPTLFSIAHFSGWREPVLIIGLFVTAELITNGLEPYIYGKSTGVSSLGLLVAAIFWTWLWGGLGLLLSTPLTVCLVVLGQYIDSFGFLATMFGESVEVDESLSWYQRVLHRDQNGALQFLDDALGRESLEHVCDHLVIPAMMMAEKDGARGLLDHQDVEFLKQVVEEWLDDLPERDGLLKPVAAPEETAPVIVGIATQGWADLLILRMVNLLLGPESRRIQLVETSGSPLQITDQVARLDPDVLFLSHLPPIGTIPTRYLIKRLRAGLGEVPMVVGYWDVKADPALVSEQMRSVPACRVVYSVASARDLILEQSAAGGAASRSRSQTPALTGA